jgi:large subunit ribosomal protein L12
MLYVYAALLLHKLDKEVNEANLTSVVKASGADVNEAQVKSLVAALADVNIDEAVKGQTSHQLLKHLVLTLMKPKLNL